MPGAYAAVGKRSLDLLGTVLLLTVCALPLAVITAAVWLILGRPVLFRQRRVGFRDQSFYVLKFRTMTQRRDAEGKLLPDEERRTRVGQFLRKWSLDELPQLLNVVRGEMSLVGPRPLLTRYLPRYSPRQRLRTNVRPGITGWAQVNGRTALDWPTRLEMDVWYVEHQSFMLDLEILLKTVGKVLKREGVYLGDSSTIEEFWGEDGGPLVGPRAFPVDVDER